MNGRSTAGVAGAGEVMRGGPSGKTAIHNAGNDAVSRTDHYGVQDLHPVWRAFVRFCRELGHGDIELLRVQDGLPVMAELTRKKVKFQQ